MALDSFHWQVTSDGFALCGSSLADILTARGITDTGISELNHRDVWSYFDDWYLCRVSGGETVYGMVKLREQEHDYVPGYADGDYPGVTVSFVPFDLTALTALPEGAGADCPEMGRFVMAFRRVTDLSGQLHSPILQRYFSRAAAEAPYLIAEQYICKLARTMSYGILPFPEGMLDPPQRIADGIAALNARAGRTICDFESRTIRVADPGNLTEEEKCVLLAAHCGNLSMNSFAAEIKFHADALISWQNRIPVLGRRKWYASAIRADMAVEHDGVIRRLFFDGYHRMNGRAVQTQRHLHGDR